jgi:hypothetical protein
MSAWFVRFITLVVHGYTCYQLVSSRGEGAHEGSRET